MTLYEYLLKEADNSTITPEDPIEAFIDKYQYRRRIDNGIRMQAKGMGENNFLNELTNPFLTFLKNKKIQQLIKSGAIGEQQYLFINNLYADDIIDGDDLNSQSITINGKPITNPLYTSKFYTQSNIKDIDREYIIKTLLWFRDNVNRATRSLNLNNIAKKTAEQLKDFLGEHSPFKLSNDKTFATVDIADFVSYLIRENWINNKVEENKQSNYRTKDKISRALDILEKGAYSTSSEEDRASRERANRDVVKLIRDNEEAFKNASPREMTQVKQLLQNIENSRR